MKISDIGTSALLIALGGGTAWQATKLSLGVPSAPGPGFFPFWLGILLIGVALIILVQDIKRKPEGQEIEHSKIRAFLALAAIFIYALLMEPLGYVLCTFLLIYFLLTMMTRKAWWFGPLVACLITLGSYILFSVCLEVLLPKGILVF